MTEEERKQALKAVKNAIQGDVIEEASKNQR